MCIFFIIFCAFCNFCHNKEEIFLRLWSDRSTTSICMQQGYGSNTLGFGRVEGGYPMKCLGEVRLVYEGLYKVF